MFDFDERNLLAFAADAGFGERPQAWDTFPRTAPNLRAPPAVAVTR